MDIEAIKQKYSDYSTAQLLESIALLQCQVDDLKSRLFGRKSERRSQDPVGIEPLFDEAEATAHADETAEPEESEASEVAAHKCKKRGKRKPLPANLPRERREYDLPDAEKICQIHKIPMVKIGEKITEQLEYIPARLKVIENVTSSYKCPCCSGDEPGQQNIVTAKSPALPIPKSFASPSLLAFILASKYVNSLPLYRLEREFSRVGVDLGRTTMARWVIQSAQLMQPLWNLIVEELLDAKVLCCDETPVQVLKEPNRSASQPSYMWVLYRPYDSPLIAFNYHTGRSGKTAAEVLDGFKGTLVCDGLKSYNSMASRCTVKLAGCLAHIRRKFYTAEKAAKRLKAKDIKASVALNWIRQLYRIEKEIKGQPPDEIQSLRNERSKPIMEEFKAWLDVEVDRTLPKSLLGKAINYSLDQWEKMQTYLKNGLVPIGRVRMWRGELKSGSTALLASVSTSCSSNRTCAANASGFRPKDATFSRLPFQPCSLAA